MSAKSKAVQSAHPLDDEGRARLEADLLRAAYAGSLDDVDTALSQGARIGAVHSDTGLTALHIAVGTNNLALCRRLIEEWHAPFGPDNIGRWPTLIAAECRVSDELADYIAEQEAKFLQDNPT